MKEPKPHWGTTPGNGGPPRRDAIAIGASAGGVEAVLSLAQELPADLPAAVFVVIHTSPAAPGFLPALIDRAGPLPAAYAVDGEHAQPGRIYVAPADHHLLVEAGGRIRAWRGPRENGFRPAIDPLFRSVARAFGPRAIGVVLSGYLDDGTLGLMLIKRRGGVAVVQDPQTAACPDMPRSAIRNVEVDHVVPLGQMPALFSRLTRQPPSTPPDASGATAMSADIRSGSEEAPDDMSVNPIVRKKASLGRPSALTCPECGGAIWEERIDSVLRYSCHLGHGYTGETLEDQYVREVEAALWSATRHMVESAELHRRLADRFREVGPADRAADYEQRAVDTERRAAVLRGLITKDRVGELVGRHLGSGHPPAPPQPNS